MQWITQNKVLFAFLLFGIAITLVLVILSLNQEQVFKLLSKNSPVEIINNHSGLEVSPNSTFKLEEFDTETNNFLEKNNIRRIIVSFTEIPTTRTVSEHVNSEQQIKYTGKSIRQDNQLLYLDIYFNPEAINLLNKDDKQLQIDALMQFFLALNDLEQSLAANGLRTE